MATKRKNKMVNVEFVPKLSGQLDFKPREFNFSEKQQKVLDCLLSEETKIVFLSGLAGTAKTYLSVYAGLHLLNNDYSKSFVYVRSLVESASKSLGYLPGSADEKFSPFMLPLLEKCEEIIEDHCAKQLVNAEKIQAIPVNHLRGASFKDKIICVDESQNFCHKELKTVLTRIGKNTKMFIAGDPEQSDINGKSGFRDFYNAFDNKESRDNGIFCFHFGVEDIFRSEILKFLMERIDGINIPIHK